jgi:adenosine/AMP kinase
LESVPNIKFGLAFCEASGVKLIRYSSTDKDMEKLAVNNAKLINAGHVFIIFLKNTFPINVLNNIKNTPEVCRIFCATANPLYVIIAENKLGRGILGVIDGQSTNNVEKLKDKNDRHNLLRKIGYKF